MATQGGGFGARLFDMTSGQVDFTDREKFYIDENDYKELWPNVNPFLITVSNARPTITQVDSPHYKYFQHRSGFTNAYCQVAGVSDNFGSGGAYASHEIGQNCQLTDIDGIVGLPTSDGSIIHDDTSWIGLNFAVWKQGTDGSWTYKGDVRVDSVSTATVIVQNVGNYARDDQEFYDNSTGIEDNDYMFLIGSSSADATTAPEAWSDDMRVVWNSCQTLETTVHLGRDILLSSLRATGNAAGSEIIRQRDEKYKEHRMKTERTLLFQNRPGGTGELAAGSAISDDTCNEIVSDADSLPVRLTMGIVPSVLRYGYTSGDYQNVFTINRGVFKWDNLVDNFEKMFQYEDTDDGVLDAYCGSNLLSYWSKMALSENSGWDLVIEPWRMNEELGWRYRMLHTPAGSLRLIRCKAFNFASHRDRMLVIPPGEIEMVQFEGDKFEQNIKVEDGYKGQKDRYMSDVGLKAGIIDKFSIHTLA